MTARTPHAASVRHDEGMPDVTTAPPHATPLEALRTVFGYDEFRGEQAAIIDTVVAGGDALVLMPTGAGKSLCYQVPALVRPGTGVVISPLIALMQDQVDALGALGVRAAFLNSTQAPEERRRVEAAYVAGELDLLYLAPERLSVASTPAAALARHDRAVRHRRGALRVLVGSRLPTRLPAAVRPGRAVARGAAHRAHRDRDGSDARPRSAHRLDLDSATTFVASFDRPNIEYRIVPRTTRGTSCSSCCAPSTPATPASSTASPASPSRRRRSTCPRTASPPCRTTPDWMPRSAPAPGAVPARARPGHGRPPSLSAWASTSPTCASSRTWTCRSPSRGTTRRPAVPAATALPATAWLAYGLADVVQQRRMIDSSEGDAAHRRRLGQHLDAMLALCETVACRRVQLLGLLRAGLDALRQLRHVRHPAADLGRARRRAEAALHRGPAQPSAGSATAPGTSSTSCSAAPPRAWSSSTTPPCPCSASGPSSTRLVGAESSASSWRVASWPCPGTGTAPWSSPRPPPTSCAASATVALRTEAPKAARTRSSGGRARRRPTRSRWTRPARRGSSGSAPGVPRPRRRPASRRTSCSTTRPCGRSQPSAIDAGRARRRLGHRRGQDREVGRGPARAGRRLMGGARSPCLTWDIKPRHKNDQFGS